MIKTAAERQKSTIAGVSSASQGRGNSNDDILLQDEEDMKPMPIASSNNGGRRRLFSLARTTKESISLASLSDMSNLNDIQILSELCVWATIFSGIAIIAAAHREVL